ncbi:uncharacterized protein LOC113317283 [Papaver somniferum]|uniref:uncharacterized protein LOC113317283 n=1 Tax=Papaver somniferum TaxID=3469 RepID=UPI000E70016B|nr:uncharacterized protein LOC113317283 [Papaver somniferum]
MYCGSVAKEYVLSSFRTLESAEVLLYEYGGVQREIGYGVAVSKFFRALSHVQCLEIYAETLETLSTVDDFVNILPHVFHDVDELILKDGKTTDKSLFLLLKALPNLRWLVFEESCIAGNKEVEHSWVGHMLTAGCMFQHLETVYIVRFSGNARQMRWVKLILKTANTLEAVILSLRSDDSINQEALMSDLQSLPRASDGCEFEFEEY